MGTDARLNVEQLVAGAEGNDDAEKAVDIARKLLVRSQALQTPQERRQQAELDRMIGHPADKATLVEMTDQAFRTMTPARVADQLTHILDLQGVPRFFSPLEQTMLRGFQSFGEYLPGVAVPLVKDKMRRETANVILPAEEEMLTEHLRQRQAEGVRMNVNFLGEALLGEDEAKRRLTRYLNAIRTPEVECVSVKITTIYSQVSPIAREETVRVVADRLELLYRAAVREKFLRADGSETSKFVYLDMEEYRDLYLTVDAMCRALERPGLENVRAGIALQAYVPDSFGVLQDLLAWSRKRVAGGGTPLTIRLVKGANMEMERVEAAAGGWPCAPYRSKRDTDANYKKMLREVLQPQNRSSICIGVASHNLFDIALAMLWATRADMLSAVQFEMLEGMANHQRRAIFEATRSMLLYAPACRRDEFLNAIGYLVRRLDENTGEENFLRHAFQLTSDSEVWDELADGFRQSLATIDQVDSAPRKTQDRSAAAAQPAAADHWSGYVGEPDTDWSVPANSRWAAAIAEKWQGLAGSEQVRVPLVIGGVAVEGPRDERTSFDPSRPEEVSCYFREANESDIDAAIDCGQRDPAGWRSRSLEDRHARLRAAAQLMRERRGDLIGAAMLDGGKTISQADPEVSEAIDFVEFYPLTVDALQRRSAVKSDPRGLVVVVSPWNFPLAIPCGGVAAALATGNTVILKPASDTVLPAWLIAKCFWDAGVPQEALQVVPCSGSRGGRRLVEDDRVQTVVLTGGTSTARHMLANRPRLHLIAETGGKNATIVTALSDRDLAIKHVIYSAFGHGGQKCSATSLLLLEDEVYEDAGFRETLADAVRSLHVGSVWDLSTSVGPLIRPPSGDLARGMKELEPGESWLVMPERVSGNPNLYRPGVKWNVKPGSFTHRTELFGPVLGVMRYRRLEDAIGIVNATGYGLTSGLESLDEREQEIWQETIRAGNLYINRPTTGAIVLRQPFGGVGSSAYGPGVKAGGPHYIIPLMNLTDSPVRTAHDDGTSPGHGDADSSTADELTRFRSALHDLAAAGQLSQDAVATLDAAIASQRRAVATEFAGEHDTVGILGQDNLRRYRPVRQMRIRLHPSDSLLDMLLSISAAIAARAFVTVSHGVELQDDVVEVLDAIVDCLPGRVEILEQSDDELAAAIRAGYVDRLRVLSESSWTDRIAAACCDAFVSVIAEPVLHDGYLETLRYLNEQSLSVDFHRYGNLGRRAAGTSDATTAD